MAQAKADHAPALCYEGDLETRQLFELADIDLASGEVYTPAIQNAAAVCVNDCTRLGDCRGDASRLEQGKPTKFMSVDGSTNLLGGLVVDTSSAKVVVTEVPLPKVTVLSNFAPEQPIAVAIRPVLEPKPKAANIVDGSNTDAAETIPKPKQNRNVLLEMLQAGPQNYADLFAAYSAVYPKATIKDMHNELWHLPGIVGKDGSPRRPVVRSFGVRGSKDEVTIVSLTDDQKALEAAATLARDNRRSKAKPAAKPKNAELFTTEIDENLIERVEKALGAAQARLAIDRKKLYVFNHRIATELNPEPKQWRPLLVRPIAAELMVLELLATTETPMTIMEMYTKLTGTKIIYGNNQNYHNFHGLVSRFMNEAAWHRAAKAVQQNKQTAYKLTRLDEAVVDEEAFS